MISVGRGWQDFLLSSFVFEELGGRSSRLWENPRMFWESAGQGGKQLDARYAEYRGRTRALRAVDLAGRHFDKVTDHGYEFRITFNSDGRLEEADTKNSAVAAVYGHWVVGPQTDDSGTVEQSDSGFLATRIGEFCAVLFGFEGSNDLKGIEFTGDAFAPNAFLRLTPMS